MYDRVGTWVIFILSLCAAVGDRADDIPVFIVLRIFFIDRVKDFKRVRFAVWFPHGSYAVGKQ